MKQIILELTYGIVTINNLQSTWIQPLTMRPGYMLCYEDDVYEKGIIYRSCDKKFLMKIQNDLVKAYRNDKQFIKL